MVERLLPQPALPWDESYSSNYCCLPFHFKRFCPSYCICYDSQQTDAHLNLQPSLLPEAA